MKLVVVRLLIGLLVLSDAGPVFAQAPGLFATVRITSTASDALRVGTASLGDTDLAKIDGITNGTPAAGKAWVGDANAALAIVRTASLRLGTSGSETTVTATGAELNYLAGITCGTVTASKALCVDANKDLATLRHLTLSGNLVTGSTTLSETDLAKIDAITNGTAAASKALVLDSNADITAGLRNLATTGILSTPVINGLSNVLQMRNGTTAQRMDVCNTWSSSISFECYSVDWQTQAGVALVGTRTAATGTGRLTGFVAQTSNAVDAYAGMLLNRAAGVSGIAGTPFVALGHFSAAGTAGTTSAAATQVALGFGTNTAPSGTVVSVAVLPTYNQTGGSTAANTDFLINRTQTAVGSGTQRLFDAQTAGVSQFSVDNVGTLRMVGNAEIAGITRQRSTLNVTDGTADSVAKKPRTITGIANNTATAVFTVTVPNASNMATIRVTLSGSLGAGGAVGAGEATGNISYDFAVTRTAGVAAVVTASSAYGSSTAAVAGAATITITAAASAVSGAVGATNTFTIQATIARGSGSSTNHTVRATAEIINANASGITLS